VNEDMLANMVEVKGIADADNVGIVCMLSSLAWWGKMNDSIIAL
jgi:hypothetical protein